MRFLSHLDIQRLLQRGLRRANLPVAYSQGFNPHPQLSFASALSVGYTSDAEWVDIRLEQQIDPAAFVSRMNAVLPEGFSMLAALEAPETLPTLTVLTKSAVYEVTAAVHEPLDRARLQMQIERLLSGPIIVNKRTKAGMRDVDIRPLVLDISLLPEQDGQTLRFNISGISDAQGSLNVALLLQALFSTCSVTGTLCDVHRTNLYFTGTDLLPNAAQ